MGIYLVVAAPIVGKQRPRFKRIGGKFMTYTPKKTLAFEDAIADEYRKQYPAGIIPFPEEPLEISCEFIFEMPKSWSNKKKAEYLGKRCISRKKPDIDNCMKSVMDALNGLAYTDDSQVTDTGKCVKIWGQDEGVVIKLRRVKE